MLTRERTSTISLTGSRPPSCLTQTVIRLKARELSTRDRAPCSSGCCHQAWVESAMEVGRHRGV